MTKIDYARLKLAFTEYGQIVLKEFIDQIKGNDNKIKNNTTKDLSKEYVTLVKRFLDEMNKEHPDGTALKDHIAKLGCQHYKMCLSLKE